MLREDQRHLRAANYGACKLPTASGCTRRNEECMSTNRFDAACSQSAQYLDLHILNNSLFDDLRTRARLRPDLPARQLRPPGEELACHAFLDQAPAVGRDRPVIPHRFVQGRPHE